MSESERRNGEDGCGGGVSVAARGPRSLEDADMVEVEAMDGDAEEGGAGVDGCARWGLEVHVQCSAVQCSARVDVDVCGFWAY